jgi:hypothetical protein
MLSTMAKGIQHSHSVVELFNKYPALEVIKYDDMYVVLAPGYIEDVRNKIGMLYDWSINHKTMVIVNAGTSVQMNETFDFLNTAENPYPWVSFKEADVYKILNAHLILASQLKTKLEQRIAELEAPKRCVDCVYSEQLNMVTCQCEFFGIVETNHFCAYYEPKDESA